MPSQVSRMHRIPQTETRLTTRSAELPAASRRSCRFCSAETFSFKAVPPFFVFCGNYCRIAGKYTDCLLLFAAALLSGGNEICFQKNFQFPGDERPDLLSI